MLQLWGHQVHPEPLPSGPLSQVPGAQRSCSCLPILRSHFIPSLWFKVPAEMVAMVERKGVFLSSLS